MVALLDPVAVTEEAPRRIRFTRGEVDRLLDLGAFAGTRFELIQGDLIDKMGQKPPQAYSVGLLMECLVRLFGLHRIRCQLPIEVADPDREFNYPEPDLVVLAGSSRDYALRHPNGAEVVLLVEVSDPTVRFDQTVKADLYARAGVPEYWVLDVNRRLLSVYRNPINGHYSRAVKTTATETVSPEAMPETAILVSDLLPPVSA